MLDHKISTFLELYDTMNYRETAKRLNMTQPAVTQHIQSLEAEYGCRLFIYDRRKLLRTKQAEQLAVYARAAKRNEKLLRESLVPHHSRTIRLGATKSIGEFVIGDILTNYLKNSSHTIELTVDNTKRLLNLIDNDEIDFAMVEGSFDKQKYGYRLFRNEPFVGICAPTHPFAGKDVPLERLFGETLILREQGSGTRAIFERVLSESGFEPGVFARTVCVSNFGMICHLVAENIGISFVYSAVAENRKDIAFFTIKDTPIVHEFNYVFLKNTDCEQMIADFAK